MHLKTLSRALALLTLLTGLLPADGSELGLRDTWQRLVFVLQLLERDYPESIEGGPGQDYAEQVVRADELLPLAHEAGPRARKYLPVLEGVVQQVRHAGRSGPVVSACVQLEREFIAAGELRVAPRSVPNLGRGKQLYARACAACHGVNGAGPGPALRALRPVPSNFWDSDLMNNLTPFEAFNAVSLGVAGTSMPSFQQALSADDRWNVVAFIATLRLPPCQGTAPLVGWEELFRTGDQELISRFGEQALACARRKFVYPKRLRADAGS